MLPIFLQGKLDKILGNRLHSHLSHPQLCWIPVLGRQCQWIDRRFPVGVGYQWGICSLHHHIDLHHL